MSTNTLNNEHHHGHEDPGPKVTFGFWTYIMTDFIMFAGLFATYVVLRNSTYGGLSIKDITNLPFVLTQTLILLASTLSYGFCNVASRNGNKAQVNLWLVVTFLLGLCFAAMGYHQLAALVASGSNWQTSAFLSAYFTLIILHGIHVVIGLLWIAVLMVQLMSQGLSPTMKTRLTCLSLFWNFISIVWIFIFTIVYLMGAV
ncbi:MAG: cytochrome o ubiquinol oxidase subunit [Gammaproteobacteria bacterium]|jgi:cytochrome o ubiquinol oxidase subunit 3|nr:cytochrome o ubiquinol oxidase subunit [Gammaproteobacteria bacterium]